MARHRDSAHPRNFVDQFLRVQPDVGEIEAPRHLLGHAEDQHVAVVGLDFGSLEHHQAELVLERTVVGAGVELAMLGEHDTVDGALLVAQFDPVEVGLQRRAAVFGGFAVAVQVEDCGHLHDVLTSPGET